MKNHNKLTIRDREDLLKLVDQKFSQREIGRQLERNQSTISRELRRAGMNRSVYSLAIAQVDRNKKASLIGRKRKLVKGSELLELVHEKIIKLHWSPEQISGYLKQDKRLRQVSYESIYRYIYAIEDQDERLIWIQALRHKKKKRYSRKGKVEKRGKIPGRVSIHDRPKHIEEREEGGHWEGDLIIGRNHASAIGTIVERKSRFTLIVHLPTEKTSEFVVKGFSDEFDKIPEELKKSLTYDNGTEMTQHKKITELTGMPVYFADPGCPGQRGTNENTNGLIREFFPKGTDFKNISEDELKRVERLLNQRPRKILGFRTPEEVFKEMERKKKPPDRDQTQKKQREAAPSS